MRVKIISKEIIYPDTVLETTTTAVPTQSTQGLLPPEVRLAPWLNEPFSAARRGPPDMHNPMIPTDVLYTVYVEKIYKGEDFISVKQLVKIRTAPFDSLCGVTGLTLRKRYVVSGSVQQGELNFGICNYIQQYSEVTRRQKQGLKYHWKKGCSECDVMPCFGMSCLPGAIPDACTLDVMERDFSCKVDYARCSRDDRGECSWYGKKDFRACQRESGIPIDRSSPVLP